MVRAASDQIYTDLKQQIENGEISYGELLPSQARLVERYQCAHNTARKAIAKLTLQGYCLPIHGKGVRIIWKPRDEAIAYGLNTIDTFTDSAQRVGFDAATKVVCFEPLVVDEELAARTVFPIGTELLHIDRVRLLDGKAIARDDSYFRASSVAGITQKDAEQSVYAYVSEQLGMRFVTRKRIITMERASETDLALLDVDGCSHLALITSHTYGKDAVLFEYTESHVSPDAFFFTDTVVSDK